jgi:hypothetical protein
MPLLRIPEIKGLVIDIVSHHTYSTDLEAKRDDMSMSFCGVVNPYKYYLGGNDGY